MDNPDIWSREKAEAFKAEFLDFLSVCWVNSKETGPTCLGDNIWGSQERLLDEVFEGLQEGIHDFKALKSRQLGCSTFARAFAIFWLGVHDGLQGALILDDDLNKEAARREVESMIDNLPDEVKFPRIKIRNRYGIILENGSKLNFLTAGKKKGQSNKALGASLGLNFVIASEMCQWMNLAGVESLKASLSKTFPNRLYLWESPLALDTPLLTTHGWTTMGAVQVGDFVFDENGQPTEVVGLSPVFYGRRCFEIVFDTGDRIISDGVHKWQVERKGSSCSRWSTQVVTTEQLDPARDRIWLGDPVEGVECDLPVHPYFIGAWLGDGHTDAVRITCGDQDMAAMRHSLKTRGVDCGLITKFKGRGGGVFGVHGMMPKFRGLNLIGNKHIPETYLRATIADRLELLRGLMDTDGCITKQAHCTFTNSSRPVVSGFCELLSSLGIRFHVIWRQAQAKTFANGKLYDCEPFAQVEFMAPEGMEVFTLPRKLERQNTGAPRRPRRNRVARILSVKEVPSVPVKCISVDTPTHLFKAGRTLIPTHNTARGMEGAWPDMWNEAKEDTLTQRTIFLGFWSRADQRLKTGSPLFLKYGTNPPDERELERIKKVQDMYGVTVDQEQLAWYRYVTDPSQSLEANEDADGTKIQEQPWDEDEAFQTTGSQFFAASRLTHAMATTISANFTAYRFVYGVDFFHTKIEKAYSLREAHLKVWQEPVDNAVYVLAADPAYGHNPDNNNAAIQVLRCYADRIEQVAEFADSETPTEQFAWVILALSAYYSIGPNYTYKNTVEVILEINGPGEAVLNALRVSKDILSSPAYKNEVIERGIKNMLQNVRQYMYQRSDSYAAGQMLQFKTSGQLKEAIMNRLRDYFNSDVLVVRSQSVIQEMQVIVRDGESIGAPGMKRDDRTIALAMGIRAWDDRLRKSLLMGNKTKARDDEARKVTPADKFQIFNRNQLDSMFQRSRAKRIAELRSQRYKSWHR